MSQYTSTATTPAGSTVNSVLSSVTNTITITATAPNGTVGTVTIPINGDLIDAVVSLRNQWTAGEANVSRTELSSGLRNAVLSTVSNVKAQLAAATAVSTTTGEPPPAESNPIPVASEDNPNRVPQTEEETQTEEVAPLRVSPNTTDGDEFDGIDQQAANTENSLQEPPQLTNEEVDTYLQTAGQESDIQENVFNPAAAGSSGAGNTGAKNDARSTATNQDAVSFEKAKDWRVRLSLAPSAKYLYKADNPGILKPLQATNGVIFPYTPTVSAVYAANYDASELVHSNYKIYNYKNSTVDTVTITGDFTAQDTNEANYLLAVIQFFKSVTKMFYGQDQNPRNGTPPPLVYMSGLGTFQFDNHPLAVTNFTYSLPNEVDYIRAGSTTNQPGSSTASQTPVNNTDNASTARIQSSGLGVRTPNFQRQQATINSNATYVPTKMQIVITCIPIVTRNDISNNFSLRDYATGALLQGSKRNGGGMW